MKSNENCSSGLREEDLKISCNYTGAQGELHYTGAQGEGQILGLPPPLPPPPRKKSSFPEQRQFWGLNLGI